MKSFLIRLLQVTWVLSLLSAAALMITVLLNGDLQEMLTALGSLAFWFAIIVIVQYLVFAKLNPKSLFDGSLTKKKS